jgi:hypothetical protein
VNCWFNSKSNEAGADEAGAALVAAAACALAGADEG